MKKILLALFVIVLAVIFLPDLLMGQVPPPPPDKPSQAPIDGGLAILATVGGAYGLKKLRDKKSCKSF